jgi:hypothetical protein
MSLSQLLWVAAAAAVSMAFAGWWYMKREEPVQGRVPAAILRGAALFLILAGALLPVLGGTEGREGGLALLVDRSVSMRLPVSPGDSSRMRAAAHRAGEIAAELVLAFGGAVSEVGVEGLSRLEADGKRSRLTSALDAARLAGADSVVVITDGELDDREEARLTAERLELGLRELRVASPVSRLGIRDVAAPLRVRAGDTARVAVEIVAGGELRDTLAVRHSFEVQLSGPGGPMASARVAVPDPGHGLRVILPLVPRPTAAAGEWRPYTVELNAEADPYATTTSRRLWVLVTPVTRGAVLVSVEPDWEPRFLLPVLRQAVPGGAVGYLRLAPARFVRMGTDPRGVQAEPTVRRQVASSDVLVIQGSPDELPEWLRAEAGRHPRLLFLARGAGAVPGSELAVGKQLEGEWYPFGPPPSPVAGYMAGIDVGTLPPVTRLRGLTGASGWSPLSVRRDRRGSEHPLATATIHGRRRVVLVLAEGTWRWGARYGPSRRLYRSLYTSLAGWLSERAVGVPVVLADRWPEAGSPVLWRIAPGVRDLSISVLDGEGREAWSGTVPEPDSAVAGPILKPGEAHFTAAGRVGDRRFTVERPFTVVGPLAELLPRVVELPLTVPAPERTGAPEGSGGRKPVWPFALAALLLCAEWIWRRHIGLR